MKKLLPFVLIIVSLFLLSACNGEAAQTPEIPLANVKVLDLSAKPQYKVVEVGTIKAGQEVELISRAAGTVGSFSVKLGDPVKAGQALAVIDSEAVNNPAKVNYSSAQLQLANAQQTYSETVANTQDSITRASLRVQTLEQALGRLQRNLEELKATTASTAATLELQLENAERNADTAEVNHQRIIDQFEQSWRDLLKNTQTSLTGILAGLEGNFMSVEGVLNPSSSLYFTVSSLNRNFGVRDSNQRLTTVNSYNTLRPKISQMREKHQTYLPLNDYTVEPAILNIKEAAEELRLFLLQVRTMFNNSIVSTDMTQATLDTYVAMTTSAETAALTGVSNANGLNQALANFKLDRISQTATADNNRVIAGNQLEDARNAVMKFKTTGPGSVRDLEVQIEQTSNELLSAQADLDSARRSAGIQASAKNLEINTLSNQVRLAEKNLEDNTITSSIDGVLSELVVDAGDYVGPGTYLGRVIQSERVKVVFYVTEQVASQLTKGQVFLFSVSSAGVHDFEGFITKIAPSADPINKKIRIEGAVENADFFLKPEMFVSLTLDISLATFDPNKIYVPMNAIIFAQNSRYVFVLEGGKALRRDIEIGTIFGSWIEVMEGLEKEDVLISEGHRSLPPAGNVEVNIVE